METTLETALSALIATTTCASRPDSRKTCEVESTWFLENQARWRSRNLKLDEAQEGGAKLARAMEQYIKTAAQNKRNGGTFLCVVGPNGTGKTHACRAAVRVLNSWAVDLWAQNYWPGGRIPAAEFAVWSKRVAVERALFEDWTDQLHQAAWIFLDDVGSETDQFRSGEPVERLRRVLDLARTHWMVVTTNIPRDKWSTAFDQRVADRLRAARIVDLSGTPSYRKHGRV